MIAVDTSALIAIALAEPAATRCAEVLEAEPEVLISAGTLAEALIVADRCGVAPVVGLLLEGLGIRVVPVTASVSHRVAAAYSQWGKGVHPAGLNFGDCFAYEIAKSNDCPLLYVGNDFAQTDIVAAMLG